MIAPTISLFASLSVGMAILMYRFRNLAVCFQPTWLMGHTWESCSGSVMHVAVHSAQLVLEAPRDDGNKAGKRSCLLFLLSFVAPSENQELEMKYMGWVLEP